MRHLLLLFPLAATLSCGGTANKTVNDSIALAESDSTLATDTTETGKSLNDIRFAGWEEKDWLDNEYIRTLRKHIDDFNAGKVKDDDLEPYKTFAKGKIAILQIEPFIWGGLYIYFAFLEKPDKVFTSWIYSEVDEETEQVESYDFRGIKLQEEANTYTKEDIIQIAKEHPETKLIW